MEKFIPYVKLSKKKKRELDAKRRSTWTINPVTRKPANPKAYNRNKAQKWRDDDSVSVPSVMGKEGLVLSPAGLSMGTRPKQFISPISRPLKRGTICTAPPDGAVAVR